MKRVKWLMLLVAVGVLVSACGGSSKTSSSASAKTTSCLGHDPDRPAGLTKITAT